MARRQSISWAELRVGILVIASFALLGWVILTLGGEVLLGETYTITAYFESAEGMTRGADVQFQGMRMGKVDQVYVSVSPDYPDASVAVDMTLDRAYLDQGLIRTDSQLTIGTIGLLGDSYLDIRRGPGAGEIVMDGGTIRGSEAGNIREIIGGANDLVLNLEELSGEIRVITSQIRQGEGTLGRMLTDDAIYDNVNATVQEANLLVRDARTGPGTIGRFMSDDALFESTLMILERMDSIVARVESGEGTLGRLVHDDTLYQELNSLVADMGDVVERVERGEGTLGRLSNDDTLFVETREAMERISSMVESVANSEGTAGLLINDPALYNNMNATVSEFLKLMYDFRQDPRRFMTVNFRLF